jgi:hypothetical protein
MPFWEISSATGSNTGTTTFTALAAVGTDTLTVRALAEAQKPRLIDFGCKHATAGMARIRSPFLHDDVNAMRFRTLAADASGLSGFMPTQKLRPQDPLIFEATGGSSAEQVSGWWLNYYDSLSGGQSTYITAAELDARAVELVSLEVPTTGVAGAIWGSTLLNASTAVGLLKADQMYAVVGYVIDVACTAVAILGPDTGNFKHGGPGVTTRQFTRNWFRDLAVATGLPAIPCINAQNLSGTSVQVVDSAGATAVNVDLFLARIGPISAGFGLQQ